MRGTALLSITMFLCLSPVSAQTELEVCTFSGEPIADFLPPVESIINVTDSGNLTDVDVSISLVHSWIPDLAISVQSPAGTVVQLHNFGGGGEGGIMLTWDDAGIPNGAAPFICLCPMQPSGPGLLADFAGENITGNWTMLVVDPLPGNDGFFEEWCLQFDLPAPPASADFTRGDCNNDSFQDLSDPIALLDHLFPPMGGGFSIECSDACDGNDDGILTIADVITLLNSLFGSPSTPLPPPETCGEDGSLDALTCESYDCGPLPGAPWDIGWEHTQGEQEPPCEASSECPDASCFPTTGPVYTHSGETVFTLSLAAGEIPGRELDWGMRLTYRSQIDFRGCVGSGWNLEFLPDRVVDAGGDLRRFDAKQARFDTYDGISGTARGLFRQVSTGPGGSLSIRRPNGLTATYAPLNGTDRKSVV